MKYVLLVLIAGNLIGCAGGGSSNNDSTTPVSRLSGMTITFTAGINGNTISGNINFDPRGSFILIETYPISCVISGTWNDENPGAAVGTIDEQIIGDSCNPSQIGLPSQDQYIISNNVITFR